MHSTDTQAGSKKRKFAQDRAPTPPPAATSRPVPAADKKRKRRSLDSVAEDSEEDSIIAAASTGSTAVKQRLACTPRHKRIRTTLPPTPADTPSKSTAKLFDSLRLDISSSAISFALNQRLDTPPLTPDSGQTSACSAWPRELDDLCNLNGAFLTALCLYYAHNGTATPANLYNLLSMITKSWKKRAVTLEDLRRVLSICPPTQQDFIIEDRGKAGLCLGRGTTRGRAWKRATSYIDEEELSRGFEDSLQRQWNDWQQSTDADGQDVTTFIEQLPLADIVKRESVNTAKPLVARGQQRLADLKAGQTAAAAANLSAAPLALAASQKTALATQSRGASLLDRILAKQAMASSLPAGPTRAQLERRSALQRIEDIARVLDLLVGGKARCSVGMASLVQRLQQSLRNPISREEAERCVELMAKEVMPSFVALVNTGNVRGVVVTLSGKPGLGELRERVERACNEVACV